MNNFKITKTILENINEQNDRINECVDIVNGYTTDEETRVNQEIQRQENELRREEQYNNNENRFIAINSQMDNKANKADLKVQSNRIDNIVAVQNSTDNIETADIRVGSNGMSYNSAGEAVREQTKKVHSNLGTNLVISKTPSYNTRVINLDYNYTFEVNKKYFFKPISYSGNTFNFVKIFLYREDGTYYQVLVNGTGKFNLSSYIEFIPSEIFIKVRFNMETTESEIGTLTCSFGAIGDLIERVEKLENNPLKNKRIGFLGDSFTDVSYYYGKKIADRVECIEFNYGVQGSRVFEDNSWTSGGQLVTKEAFWKRVLKMDLNLDCICIYGGINDSSTSRIYKTNLGTIDDNALSETDINNGSVPSTFYSAYKTVIELAMTKYPQKKILIIIPPHVLNATYSPSIKAYNGIEKIIEAERKVAEYYGIKVCDLYKNCQELNNFSGNVATYRIGDSDDIHPNNLGHEAMSVLIQKSLEDIFL